MDEKTNIKSVKRRRSSVEFFTMLAENRKTMLIAIVVSVVLFFGLTYVLPQTFESMATVLPPEHQGMGGMLTSMLSGSAVDLLKGGENPTLELFKTIIESRTVATEVAKDPKIHHYFAAIDSSEKNIVGAVQASVQSEALRTGMFTVTVNIKTPMMASQKEADEAKNMSAYVANRFVVELDRFNRERLMTSAHNSRVFIEREYENRLAQLDTAYRGLQQFQEAHKAISLPEQLGASVTAAAKLTSQIQQLQMQLNIEQSELNANSGRIQLLTKELEAGQRELQKYDDGGVGEYVIALKNVPELSRELANHMRETKVLEQVTAYLRQQLEQERISEQRDLPSLQTLDVAQVPNKRASPSRSTFSLIGLLVGFLIGSLILVIRNFNADVRENPAAHYRLLNLLRALRGGKGAVTVRPINTASTDAGSMRSPVSARELA